MSTSARTHTVLRTSATLALALAGLVGQAAHADNLNPILGGGLGAMAGAVIGQSMGGRDGAMVGAAIGGVAGVSIASQDGYGRRYEPARTVVYPVAPVVYQRPYQPAPVYAAPVYAPVYAPSYGYRVVERVNYYPVPEYRHHGWGHDHDDRRWERHDWDHRGGEHRGWGRD